jgi:NOL1/NOP2/sun family putative RNA methylase
MSEEAFLRNRYSKLGWSFKAPVLRQAIRINESLVKECEIIQYLRDAGVFIEKIPFLDNGYWVKHSRVSVGATAEYLLGFYSVQEAAAQIPADLFSGIKGKLVLDACAAPGGKTVQLADKMGGEGIIIALDVSKGRMVALANHLERCRVNNSIVYRQDARKASALHLRFDRVLLDVPCSGNFASDINWFRRRTLQDIERNAALQREILTEASSCLSEDGEIVYSTCSLEPEENEMNMDWAIKHLNLEIEEIKCKGEEGLTSIFGQNLDASIKRSRRIWPDETQGFFVCKLKLRKKKTWN